MSEQLGEAVLVLRTDDRGLDSGLASAKGKSEQLGRTLDATSGSATRMGGALTGAGRDAVTGSAGLEKNMQAARGLDAMQRQLTASSGMQRQGFQQLAMNIGDMSTMYALGASPMRIFASQSSQVFQAIQMVSGGSSSFAAFMGGPWGIAIAFGVQALVPLVGMLFDTEDAAGKAGKANETLADKLDRTKHSYDEVKAALREYNAEQRKANETTLDSARVAALATVKIIGETVAIREKLKAQFEAIDAAPVLDDPNAEAGRQIFLGSLSSKIAANNAELAKLAKDARDSIVNVAVELATLDSDPTTRIRTGFGELRKAAKATIGDVKELRARLADLDRQEKAQLDAERKTARESRGGGSGNETSRFIMPVSGRTTGVPGEKRPGHTHAGIDIAVPVGTPVRAPAGGTVIEAGTVPGYGNVVFIDHGGGTISRLAHLSRIGVAKGQAVDQGDTVGLSGGARGAPGAGNSRGPHLHYEVRVGGKPMDPRKGSFRTDAMGAAERAGDSAEQAARKREADAARAEREREAAVRRKQAFDNASAGLDDRLLQLKQQGLSDAAAIAQVERERIRIAADRFNAEQAAKVATGDLSKAQAQELVIKHAILSALQVQLIDAEEQARRISADSQVALQLGEMRLELLQAQEGLAKTTAERRDLALAMLAEEERQARIEAQRTIDLFALGKATKAEAEAAQRRLDQIDKLHPLRVQAIERQNQGPLGRFLDDTDPATTRDRVDALVSEEFMAVRRGINDAIADQLGVNDPLIQGLLEMVLDELLFRPIAEILRSKSGGGLGGLLSGILSIGGALFGGGGPSAALTKDVAKTIADPQFAGLFAEGGLIPNGSYGIVGEQGPEKIFATNKGIGVLPNSALRRDDGQSAGRSMQLAFHNDFRGADASAVAAIQGRIDRMHRELPGQILTTMQDARARFAWR